jgi:N-acetylated-alpha-linked acidic dipeptidase
MSMDGYHLYDRDEPALSGVERDLYDAVSADEPWALVERFSELERVSPSEDERRAAEYVTDRLSSYGVDHERHDPELYVSVPEDASLALCEPDVESFDAVKTVAFGASGRVEAPLVAAGEGGGAEDLDALLEADVSDLDDVAGKAVLVSGILPIDAIQDLEARGAAAVVVQHPHEREPHEGIATPVWGGAPEPGEMDRVPDLPIVTVARPVGERLREAAEDGDAVVELSADVDTGWRECPLVEARIEGGGDGEGFVLLHGHYDSWHVGVADNATGDAGLLECARVFEEFADELERDLRVCWWPAHSTGRYAGSTWYAETFARDIEQHCVAHVNMDSPGAADATEFGDMVDWMPEAAELCLDAMGDVAGKSCDADQRPARAGDYSFNNLGVTGAFMLSSHIPADVRDARGYHPVGGCGGNANAWHLSTDTLDKADPDVLVRDIRVYTVALARLLRADVLPIDHRDAVARHEGYLADYDAAAGDTVDLSPAREALTDLGDALDDLYDAAGEDVPAADANEAIRAVSRRLVRLSFCDAGAFEQDPATPRAPYPALAVARDVPEMSESERKHARVALRRGQNRVVHELDAARAAVEAAL